MLNIIFVSDDSDSRIGPNCTLSHENLVNQINLEAHNVILLNGDKCTADEVESAVRSFNGEKFLFVAFSHGCEDSLLSNEGKNSYVSAGNSYFFSTSLVYTNSCYSGVKLKGSLIEAGCWGYVGYTDQVRLPVNEDDDILFIACENSGLVHFMNTGESLSESIAVMQKKYQDQYNSFVKQNMNVAAALLLHNLNCLTFYDDGMVTRDAFEN